MFKQIIWLNGMPRSGTSWLSQIFDSCPDVKFRLMPLFSYAFKNRISQDSKKEEINKFFKEVYLSNDDFLVQKDKRESEEYPIFKQKNKHPKNLVIKHTRYHNLTEFLLENCNNIKFIHIIRNPCAIINSWINIDREFKNKGCKVKKDWRTGQCRKTGPEEFWGFDDWKNVTSLYLKLQDKYPSKIKIIQYENLVNSPIRITKKIFKFTDIKTSKQTMKFLKESQSNHQQGEYSVFKNPAVKNKWKKQLNKKIIKEIYEDLKGDRLEQFLK